METNRRSRNRPLPCPTPAAAPDFFRWTEASRAAFPGILEFLCLFALLFAGCVSKSTARLQAEKAFLEGQQKALTDQQQQQQPVVWFRGDVRNQRIPWSEGLTLSRALLAAQYTWNRDPRTVTVTRAGELYAVDPKRLLRGLEDPELQPDDVIEVRH